MKQYRMNRMSEALAERLSDMGIDVIEESFGRESTFAVYGDESVEAVLRAGDAGDIEITDVEETGWQDRWKDFLKGGWLTDSIWFDFEPRPDIKAPVIRITPAMAFGTGTHPTTRLAARLAEPVCRDAVVLDVGTGSGILSMAAVIAGAAGVYAFDIDPVAVKNTLVNIHDNGCTTVHAWAGELASVRRDVHADVIIANIITSVLTTIHDDIVSRAPESIIYSGIMAGEADGFIQGLRLGGYVVAERQEMEGWVGFRLERGA